MNWLEHKYIGQLSSRLRNFKKKSGSLYNFSCCFCGDSKTDKRKARAYIYSRDGATWFHCHNCNLTYGFKNFLKNIDVQLFSEYSLEAFKNDKSPRQVELETFVNKMKKPVFMRDGGPISKLKKISQLDPEHKAKKFVVNRKIPNEYHSVLLYTPKFMTFVNEMVEPKYSKETILNAEHDRIVIPFINEEGNVHAFQGRSLDPNEKNGARYISIVTDESVPKIFGLDRVNTSKKYYAFEGPIDSMFVPNSIASAGGDILSSTVKLAKKNMVVVYDNEPRNKDTVKKLEKAATCGYQVCVWSDSFDFKDVNEAVMGGLEPDYVKYIIDNSTFVGLGASARIASWKKV